MNKLIQYIAILCIVMSMSSCRFSEECNYTGNVELIMDWESMWGDLLKPDSLTTLFYHNDRLSALRTLLGDTVYEAELGVVVVLDDVALPRPAGGPVEQLGPASDNFG